MRYTTKILQLLVLTGILTSSAWASPITYNLSFVDTLAQNGPPVLPTFGSFTYDDSQPYASRFTDFRVDWYGVTFDLTSAANAPLFQGPGANECGTSATGSAVVFAFLTGEKVCGPTTQTLWQGNRASIPSLFNFAIFAFQAANVNNVVSFGLRVDNLSTDVPPPFPATQGVFSAAQQVGQVPEPATFALTALGGLVLAFMCKRQSLGCRLFGGPTNIKV
jgi:hypothetical protein